jgi:hypothetical protein
MTTEIITLRRDNWILEWVSTRPNSVWAIPAFTKSKTFSDSGIMYDNGTVAWNFPERIPQTLRNVAPAFIRKCQG